jgi:hypothetical protein
MQRLGIYIKVFQFGVCIYDLLVLDQTNVVNNVFKAGMLATPEKAAELAFGLLLFTMGQVLNYFVFEALGAKGVYYGYEFGYKTARVSSFPYNLNISDPQYWGTFLSIYYHHAFCDVYLILLPFSSFSFCAHIHDVFELITQEYLCQYLAYI